MQNSDEYLCIIDKPWRLSSFMIMVTSIIFYLFIKNLYLLSLEESLGYILDILFYHLWHI